MIDSLIITEITKLGEAKIPSPILDKAKGGSSISTVSDEKRILVDVDAAELTELVNDGQAPLCFELAGPRGKIFFDPSKLRCGLVTCGGLCPGLNDIIRSVVFELYYGYGVKNINGIRYGLEGFIPKYGHDVINLTPDYVANINKRGGSVLGSSRGPQDIEEIIDCLDRMNIGILFMIGGDGTLMAATLIADAIESRNLKISVVGGLLLGIPWLLYQMWCFVSPGLYEHERKFVVYLMSCNTSEVLVVTLATISGAPLPLLPLQILFLNLVTDVFPALALGVGEGSRLSMASLRRRRDSCRSRWASCPAPGTPAR